MLSKCAYAAARTVSVLEHQCNFPREAVESSYRYISRNARLKGWREDSWQHSTAWAFQNPMCFCRIMTTSPHVLDLGMYRTSRRRNLSPDPHPPYYSRITESRWCCGTVRVAKVSTVNQPGCQGNILERQNPANPANRNLARDEAARLAARLPTSNTTLLTRYCWLLSWKQGLP